MEELGRKSVEEFKRSRRFPSLLSSKISAVRTMSEAFSERPTLSWLKRSISSATLPDLLTRKLKKQPWGLKKQWIGNILRQQQKLSGELKNNNYRVLAVEQAEGSCELQALSCEVGEKLAVVFGNEVTGVEQSTIHLCDACIEIPQLGMKHSLNIATAAGSYYGELVRTRINERS